MTVPQNVEDGDHDAPGDFGRLEQRKLLPGARRDTSPFSIAAKETHL
jgi:hypothetical protein